MKLSDSMVRPCGNSRRRTSIASFLAALGYFWLLYSFALAAVVAEPGPRYAFVRTGQYPGVRFTSGLTVCDEELRNGRWVSR
jgi:hypothetical protein